MPQLTDKYERKPFPVDAVRVTEENMAAVRKWCDGRIEKVEGSDVKCIFVRVANPATDRQNKAMVGHWLVYMPGSGYKVYTHQAFKRTFRKAEAAEPIDMIDTAKRLSTKEGVRVIAKKVGAVKANIISPTSTEESALTEKENKK